MDFIICISTQQILVFLLNIATSIYLCCGFGQRLEFLGDSVLDYLITSYLYSAYPKLKPGLLTDLRSVFVMNEAFANVAVDRLFYKFLICDSTSLRSNIESYANFIQAPPSERASLEQLRFPRVFVSH